MNPEAHLIIGSGPRAGTVFVIPAGAMKRFGSDPRAEMRLPDLPPAHSELRFTGLLEVRDIQGQTVINGAPLQPQRTKALRPGDELKVGPYEMRVELHGLAGSTMAAARTTARLEPQTMPPGYSIDGQLGSGAFGAVYAARRNSDNQRVALKVLRRPPSEKVIRRFAREVKAARNFVHPNIVRVFEMDILGPPPFIAMELIEGPSAEDLLSAGPLPVPKALRIAAGLAAALQALGQARFVHRDVKPANVLVAAGDVAKLADFGLAKDLDGQVSALTATGVGIGTLAYMAPEQLRDSKRVEPAADAYALGATLYALLYGLPPFVIMSTGDMRKIFNEEPAPITRADCPPQALQLISAAMRKDPTQRPPIYTLVNGLNSLLRMVGG